MNMSFDGSNIIQFDGSDVINIQGIKSDSKIIIKDSLIDKNNI